jgi:MOSC domain-containing protein YiiM
MIEVLTRDKSRWPLAGDQLFVDFDLSINNLVAGDRLQVGEAVLQITAEPHRGCHKFKKRFGPDALAFVNSLQGDQHRLRGVYARIVSAGEVGVGDSVSKVIGA